MSQYVRASTSITSLFLLIVCILIFNAASVSADEAQTVAGTVQGAVAAPLTHEQQLDLFVKAKDLFNQANALYQLDPDGAQKLYLQSALYFERIAQDGKIQSGKLFYNIGNCYYRVGDIGRAILNYRRAQQYLAQDPNVMQNLAAARAGRLDKIDLSTQSQIMNILFFWHYDISSFIRLIVFSCSFILIWLLALVRFFLARKGHAINGIKWGILAASLLAVLMFSSLLISLIDSSQHRPGVVLATEVTARKGNSETYQPSFQEPLHAGTEFELIEARGAWLQVKLADGRSCWLPIADVELVR